MLYGLIEVNALYPVIMLINMLISQMWHMALLSKRPLSCDTIILTELQNDAHASEMVVTPSNMSIQIFT